MCIIFQHVTSKAFLFWNSHFKYFLLFFWQKSILKLFHTNGKIIWNQPEKVLFWHTQVWVISMKFLTKSIFYFYQFHHCKYKINCPHNCKYLLIFNEFTIDNDMFTHSFIFHVFYTLNLLEVSISFKNGPMNF